MANDRKKIIVVDDNPENLTALKNTLKDIYDVYPSPSALKMFDLLEHIRPDLILLDVEMPGMNGYEAVKILKDIGKYRSIPIMFLTAMGDTQNEMDGLRFGAVDYIHKPFVAPLLLQRIKTHLTMAEQQKEIEKLLELKTREVSLREAAETEARNASRAKSEFLSHMSHEIRSPLNAIIGMITIAANSDDINRIKYCLERAENASKHVLGIINDILDMSKIEANKLELSYSEFDFEKMLTGIVNVTSVRAEEKHQKLIVNLNTNVPPFIISDELRLSQIITNLLTNAFKFTPENGTVTLSAEKTEDAGDEITLRIEVADTGIGISEEQQKRLFTSYNQAEAGISKKFGGTGLGLAISRRIVELMQGKIWIESELNRGSKFIFTIEVKKGTTKEKTESSAHIHTGGITFEAEPETNSGKPDESGDTDFNFKGYTILAAEDMAFNREILAKYLEKTGISVDFAVNGAEAVSMFREHPDTYSLILMDVQMPEMDGYDATRAIRVLELPRAQDICIIAMTANVFKEDIEKCLAAGMNEHIGKPIFPKDILALLKKHLS